MHNGCPIMGLSNKDDHPKTKALKKTKLYRWKEGGTHHEKNIQKYIFSSIACNRNSIRRNSRYHRNNSNHSRSLHRNPLLLCTDRVPCPSYSTLLRRQKHHLRDLAQWHTASDDRSVLRRLRILLLPGSRLLRLGKC